MTEKRTRGAWHSALAVALATAVVGGLASEAIAAAGSGGIGSGGDAGTTVGTTSTVGSRAGVFPVRAHHTYGDGIGAGRGHQGQDILAKCGKPVVVAQPGRVERIAYQSAAGNYVVIDGRRSAADTVYMHLSKRSKLREGQRVAAGTLVGRVGDTGDATTCHLHFEMWSPPGWYKGGDVIDPEPYLRRWDKTS